MKLLVQLIVLLLTLVLVQSATYKLPEYEQAILLQMGEVKGKPLTSAGLKWKIPFIQDVRYFPKRILQYDGGNHEITSKDRKFIWVDTAVRWRIDNALTFYKTLRDIHNADARMSSIIGGVTKDIVSSFNLVELVRSSNDILDEISNSRNEAEKKLSFDPSDTTVDDLTLSVDKIETGRERISELITERSQKELKDFGIEVLDVNLRSISYKQAVLDKVYTRMISEREKIAAKIRSLGVGEKEKIMGQMAVELKQIESDAYKKSQKIKGHAEAKAAKIYAASLYKDPEFYQFIKTLETYKSTIATKGKLILSTESEFLKLLQKGS